MGFSRAVHVGRHCGGRNGAECPAKPVGLALMGFKVQSKGKADKRANPEPVVLTFRHALS
jgi:hypothetical protein